MVDFEAEYVNPIPMPEALRQGENWASDSAAYREAANARATFDVAYGDKARQRLDIFAPTNGADGPVALFLHGGYWQWMDRSLFSHMARGVNEHGMTAAVAGYTLCPEATVAEIVEEIRKAVAFVAKRFGKPVTVYGHSAGGTLTACMLATDWQTVDPTLASDTVPSGLAISVLADLTPLISTTLNDKLGLDAVEAHRLSPLYWRAPVGKRLIAYVGANESSEFLRQTRALVACWSAVGVRITGVEVSGANHLTVIAPLADPASSMTRDLVRLARNE